MLPEEQHFELSKKLEIFKREEKFSLLNLSLNDKIIQYELYHGRNRKNVFTFYQLKDFEEKKILFFKKKEVKINILVIVKINDRYTIQINEEVYQKSFDLSMMVAILNGLFFRINKQLVVSDYTKESESNYLQKIEELDLVLSRPPINNPIYGDGSENLKRETDFKTNSMLRNGIDLMDLELKEFEEKNPNYWDKIKKTCKANNNPPTGKSKKEMSL